MCNKVIKHKAIFAKRNMVSEKPNIFTNVKPSKACDHKDIAGQIPIENSPVLFQ